MSKYGINTVLFLNNIKLGHHHFLSKYHNRLHEIKYFHSQILKYIRESKDIKHVVITGKLLEYSYKVDFEIVSDLQDLLSEYANLAQVHLVLDSSESSLFKMLNKIPNLNIIDDTYQLHLTKSFHIFIIIEDLPPKLGTSTGILSVFQSKVRLLTNNPQGEPTVLDIEELYYTYLDPLDTKYSVLKFNTTRNTKRRLRDFPDRKVKKLNYKGTIDPSLEYADCITVVDLKGEDVSNTELRKFNTLGIVVYRDLNMDIYTQINNSLKLLEESNIENMVNDTLLSNSKSVTKGNLTFWLNKLKGIN